jgi:hypothetical protein
MIWTHLSALIRAKPCTKIKLTCIALFHNFEIHTKHKLNSTISLKYAMKKLSPFFFLIALYLPAHSQTESIINSDQSSPWHKKTDLIIALTPALVHDVQGSSGLSGGLKLQFFLGERFSLDADIVANNGYVHFSPALIGIPLGLIGLSEEEQTFRMFFLSLAGIALAAEHFSIYFPLKKDMELSPYISLLRYKIRWSNDVEFYEVAPEGSADQQFCFATGLQLNKYFGRFLISPYADYSIGYNDHLSCFQAGVHLGIQFR